MPGETDDSEGDPLSWRGRFRECGDQLCAGRLVGQGEGTGGRSHRSRHWCSKAVSVNIGDENRNYKGQVRLGGKDVEIAQQLFQMCTYEFKGKGRQEIAFGSV